MSISGPSKILVQYDRHQASFSALFSASRLLSGRMMPTFSINHPHPLAGMRSCAISITLTPTIRRRYCWGISCPILLLAIIFLVVSAPAVAFVLTRRRGHHPHPHNITLNHSTKNNNNRKTTVSAAHTIRTISLATSTGMAAAPLTMPTADAAVPEDALHNSRNNVIRAGDIARELQTLADVHGMEERQFLRRSRNKLQPRHMAEFSSDALFDQFARVVCQVMVIPRKEIFETWAMALYVHHHFPHATRIADLACSHGLLSWALLLLAAQPQSQEQEKDPNHHESTTNSTSRSRTNTTDAPIASPPPPSSSASSKRSVICIDLNMPKSAEKIATVMLQTWPNLKDSWDYVEGPLEALQPDPSTLLVGIHACGLLSDKIVSLAIQGNASLALVPCCHSKKSLPSDQKAEFQKIAGLDDTSGTAAAAAAAAVAVTASSSLADVIDQYRIKRLQTAGFIVEEARIPSVFTPKNRIIIGTPSSSSSRRSGSPEDSSSTTIIEPIMRMSLTTKGNPKWGLPKFCIPVADTPTARSTVRDLLAGRAASLQRQVDPPVSLCVSLFLPPDHIHLSAQELSVALPVAEAQIEAVCKEPFWHAEAQRHARTFKVTYAPGETKKRCKEYHQTLRETIPKLIPGANVRY